MTRRLRIASTAFGALLVPACASFQPDATVMHPVAPPTPTGLKPLPGQIGGQTQAAKPRAVEKFAEGRTESAAFAEQSKQLPTPPVPTSPPISAPAPVEQAKFQTTAEPVAPPAPPRLTLRSPDREPSKPAPEPVPDAEGVIRPSWPVIKGVPGEVPTPFKDEPKLTLPAPGDLPPVYPPFDRAPMPTPPDAPAANAPPVLPPGVIGSSIHKSNASPAGSFDIIAPVAAVELSSPPTTVEKPVPTGSESPLIGAVRAFQANKPDEAVECLKSYDPATQQILLSLLPALGRLSDGKLQQMKPEEMDVLLVQLTKVPNMLRPRASLQANNVRLCREVLNFAHVEPFLDRHAFRAGDIVYLYMELANFSCVPVKGGYAVTLASTLELKDAAGVVVWQADPKEVPDQVSSPPQDYYRNFRLSIPNVPAGTYALTVKATDRPTGREVQKTVELRVGR